MNIRDRGVQIAVAFVVILGAGDAVSATSGDKATASTGKSTVSIELPALAGGYHIGDNTPSQDPTIRSVTFAIPDSIADVGAMRLVVSATWTHAIAVLARTFGASTSYDTLPCYIPFEMKISAAALGDCYLYTDVGGSSGTWILDNYLNSQCESRYVYARDLIGMELTAELYVRFDATPNRWLIQDAFGTAHAVSLQLEYAVPDESPTWGELKALYR